MYEICWEHWIPYLFVKFCFMCHPHITLFIPDYIYIYIVLQLWRKAWYDINIYDREVGIYFSRNPKSLSEFISKTFITNSLLHIFCCLEQEQNTLQNYFWKFFMENSAGPQGLRNESILSSVKYLNSWGHCINWIIYVMRFMCPFIPISCNLSQRKYHLGHKPDPGFLSLTLFYMDWRNSCTWIYVLEIIKCT